MSTWDPASLSSLALAFVGDAVWGIYVRDYVLALGIRRPAELHKQSTYYVMANAQARVVQHLWDGLTEVEQGVVKRGRNAKSGTVRKHADILDYRHSTGFEALIGFLYGQRDRERLDNICLTALRYLHEHKEG